MQSSPARSIRFLPIITLICALSPACSVSKAATQAAGADTGSNAASATTAVPSALPANTISITVEKIEPVNGIAHRYLSQSSLMLASELESQIREANQLPAKQLYVKKGQTLLIPNIEAQPVVE